MNFPSRWVMTGLLGLAVSTGCNPSKGDHAHGAGSGDERPGLSRTVWTDRMEAFVEFRALVAGQESSFAAHLTHLEGFKAVTTGKVTLTLSGPQGKETFEADPSTSPGIFRPVAKPTRLGKVQANLTWQGPEGKASFDLGTVEVYGSVAQAQTGEPEGPAPAGVPFLKEQQWKVEFATAEARSTRLRQAVEAYAQVIAGPGGEARLQAPFAGRLDAPAYPYVGMPVKRGQVLATVVPRPGGETDGSTLSVDAERARLRLEQATRQLARLKDLLATESVPRRRVEEATQDEALARAESEAASRRLAEYRQGRGGSGMALVSPISGTVASVSGAPGSSVVGGQDLFQVVDGSRVRLDLQIPEADATRVQKPVAVWFQPQGLDHGLEFEAGKGARFMPLGAAVSLERRTVPLVVEVANPGGLLRVGATGKAQVFFGPGEEGLVIPVSALQEEDGAPVVYVQAEGERFERRVLRLGTREGDRVQVREGLKAGEHVVVKGSHLVRLAGSSGKVPEHGHTH